MSGGVGGSRCAIAVTRPDPSWHTATTYLICPNSRLRPERADDLSVFDLIRDQIGIIETGVGDLASNPKHLEGFGR